MEIILEVVFGLIGAWVEHRKKKNRPVPKIVGSVPYHPVRKWPS
ncbi:hypothetical protein [Bradyrhizobium sp. dw_411]|nr:hypothetical protein [Bradyrhizobium sp. dw_411]